MIKKLKPPPINIDSASTSSNAATGVFPIVGIGASAGGIEAMSKFFSHMPPINGMSFVVIQHLEPAYKSLLVELLQQVTSMKIYQADNRMKVKPNCVYVIPPDKDLTILDGTLRLMHRPIPPKQHLPIDFFFQALAEDRNEFAVGVVLYGMGPDGTDGIQHIKRRNGLTFVQEPSSCEFDGMPRSAINSGFADFVGPAEELPDMIIANLKHTELTLLEEPDSNTRRHQSALDKIIFLLHERTGNDFSQYKKNTMYRRIERQMKRCHVGNIAAYVHYLHENSSELDILFKDLLINVTQFFRNPEVWQYLELVILPTLLAKKPTGGTLRAWIPACSSGEEAYSLAILFKEALDQIELNEQFSLKIFATDLDQNALNKARKGFYPVNIAENISVDRLNRFFITYENGYQIKEEIREMVIFAQQNIATDTPFSKLDILSCRNLLIYFDRGLQEKLLPLFHYALNPDGFLLLGTAETIGGFYDLFDPVDGKLRIYKRIGSNSQNMNLNFPITNSIFSGALRKKNLVLDSDINIKPSSDSSELKELATLSVVINGKGEILSINKDSNTLLKLNDGKNLLGQVNINNLESLITELKLAREEIHAAHEEMQTSQEELRSSNEELHSINEELSYTNQKLVSSNEELVEFKSKLLLLNEQLRETNIELITYLKAIGELALVSVSDCAGRITEANEKFCEVSGYSKEELIGQNHRILNSRTHPKDFFVEMWATIAHGDIWHKEICNRKKNGQLYWVDSTIVPLKDNDGRITRYISVRVDISTRKLKELALNERLKERSCLYAIHRDMARDLPIKKLCTRIFKHLISAMQFPELAVCKIELYEDHYTSKNYKANLTHSLSTKIKANEKTCGQLQVYYTEDKPFLLPDEQNLINYIAEDLRMWLERKHSDQHINHMASHDVLTGLPNRLLLQDRLTQALAFNQRHHECMSAVLFIDLDNFKAINDTFGHTTGDLLLKKVGERLLSSIRNEDTAARQGGDEFIVLLPHIMDKTDVEEVTQKILTQLSLPYEVNEHEFFISGSIGIALYPEHGLDASTLLKHCDTALYYAKTLGRNNYQFFSAHLNHQVIENHEFGNYLRSAIKNNQLLLHYQPILDVNHNLVSMEALLRWQHSEKGSIPPSRFIPIAEDTGLILPLGEWVMNSVCKQINDWENKGYNVPKIAINISAKQFRQKTFFNQIEHILEKSNITANHIILEITESLLMADIENISETLHQLSEAGFKIAIDDFGTGYSSLTYLKHYPIDKLKIDQSFVRDIATDENDAAIVTATISMAHDLGMKVIAEGVETNDQFAFLTQKGCDLYQGYYFSKPLPSSEIVDMFKLH